MADSEQPASDSDAGEPDLSDLTLKERVVLATVQQPAVGLLLVLMVLFSIAFFVALALAFPGVAGLFVLLVVAIGLLGGAVFAALRRFDRD